MAVYRYAESGIRKLVAEARRTALIITGLAFLAGLAIVVANARGGSWTVVAFIGLMAALVLTVQWRTLGRRVAAAVRSTEIELTDTHVTGRSNMMERTIGRGEISELRRVPEGLRLRGKNAVEILVLRRELEGFAELAAHVEQWAPPGVRRTESGGSIQTPTMLLVGASLALMLVSFGGQDYRWAAPAAISLAVLMLGCFAVLVRDPKLPARFRWMSVLGLLPAAAALWRAYLLYTMR